jgi:hypothetical protein
VDKHVEWASNWLRQLKASKPHVLDIDIPNLKNICKTVISLTMGGQRFLTGNLQSLIGKVGHIKLQKEGVLKIDIAQFKFNMMSKNLLKTLLIKFASEIFPT